MEVGSTNDAGREQRLLRGLHLRLPVEDDPREALRLPVNDLS